MKLECSDLPIYQDARWWKGNLHMHSLWSDGDDFPEIVAAWYKSEGYHFISFSEHDRIQEGSYWLDAEGEGCYAEGVACALPRYRELFGENWVEERFIEGRRQVRVKPIHEYRPLLEEPGRFLILQGEEITATHRESRHWLNATNIWDAIPPQTGQDSVEVMQNVVAAADAQAQETGRRTMLHLDHPNYDWNALAEDVMQVEQLRFMEIHTACNSTHSYGDNLHPGAERLWDIALAFRLGVLGTGVMYGIATDDSHQYHEPLASTAPGRAWVMVRSHTLTPEGLLGALGRGDFYASTGVMLRDVHADGSGVFLDIQGEEGVEYITEFRGTLRGFDASSTPILDDDGTPIRTTARYSEDIGKVLAEASGLQPFYEFSGEEIYVRATVISNKPHPNPHTPDDVEKAWIQPVFMVNKAPGTG